MSITGRLVVVVALLSLPGLPALAQDASARPYPAGCAPQMPGAVSADRPTIVGGWGPDARTLLGINDQVIISTGTAGNLTLGQRYYVRRQVTSRLVAPPRPVVTAGGLRIIAVNERTAIGRIDLGCDGIFPGDFLEPAPSAPQLDAGTAQGELDFSAPLRVLFGDHGKAIGANGDMMFVELGAGVAPGANYAVYRDLQVPGIPLTPIGEAIVVSVGEQAALVLLTKVRDSVRSGDFVVPKTR